MYQQNHQKRKQPSDPSYRPKDSFRQEESGPNRNNRTLGDRIHLPSDRLQLPEHQNHNNPKPANPGERMDYQHRNGRYFNHQGDGGGRGGLDGRIGGFTDHPRGGNGGKQYAQNRREEPISYDDKPTSRNVEERVYVDSRTLEERISGANPTPAKRFYHKNGPEGNFNKPGNNNPTKQGKKGQNKAHKQAQANRNQGTVAKVLTEPQSQEETSGGAIVAGSATITNFPAITAIAEEASLQQGKPKQIQNIISQVEAMDGQFSLTNLQFEGASAPMAIPSSPSPVATSLQEQLREKVLASMQKKKAQAEAEARGKDATEIVNTQNAQLSAAIDIAAVGMQSTENYEEKSALTALENSLNSPVSPVRKRRVDPERDAAVDAMLAEVQASSSGTEDKRTLSRKTTKDEIGVKIKEKANAVKPVNALQQPSHSELVPKVTAPTEAPNITDNPLISPREDHTSEYIPRQKEIGPVKETDAHSITFDSQPCYSGPVTVPSDTRQKPVNLPPLQTSTPVSQTSAGKPLDRHDKFGEDDEDYWRKEKLGPHSAPLRHQPYDSGRRLKDVDDILEQPSSAVERRPRYWEERAEVTEQDHKRLRDDLRRLDKQPSRSHLKEDYRDDVYRIDGGREEEAREQYYVSQRLQAMPPPTRPLLTTEEFNYPPEYPPYSIVRYLPIRGEEHLARPHEYDPYYKDVAEWLEITGFHDVDYRQTALRRHRERELDRLYAMRVAAANAVTRGEDLSSPIDRRAISASSLMPPPQVPGRGDRGNAELPAGVAIRMGMYTPRPPLPTPPHMMGRQDERIQPTRYNEGYIIASPPLESLGSKRRIPQEEPSEGRRPEKSSRTAYEIHPRNMSPRPEDQHIEYRSRPDPIESGSVRRILDNKEQNEITPSHLRRRGRPNTPVRELQEKLAARSPSPSRFHENEQRRAAFKDAATYKARLAEDEQGAHTSYRSGKKPYEKGDRRGSPTPSPRLEKGYHRGRGGFHNTGRYQQMGDDHKPPSGNEYDDGFRSPGRGNFGHRRGSVERKPGYGRGNGDYGREWYNRVERREKPSANRTILGSEHMDVDYSSGATSIGRHSCHLA